MLDADLKAEVEMHQIYFAKVFNTVKRIYPQCRLLFWQHIKSVLAFVLAPISKFLV